MDIPAGLGVRNIIDNVPDGVGGGDFKYDTLQFAFNKRFGSGLFIQSSFDYQWRDELKKAINNTNSPLNSDPLEINYFQNVVPEVSNRQESTNWQGARLPVMCSRTTSASRPTSGSRADNWPD